MDRAWIADKGFLTFAFNTRETNYLDLAYRLAESIRDTQTIDNVSVVIDNTTAERVRDKHQQMFDRIVVKGKTEGKKDHRHQSLAWQLTPYKQTIKIESDMLMTGSIDHWWEILDERDVCLTSHVFTHMNQLITDRSQRKLFDDNNLPDVYNAITYFRYSRESQRFFDIVASIYDNWPLFRDQILKNCRYEDPVTDEVFAIAAMIYGVERCTLPFPVPAFLHMKNRLLEIPDDLPWTDYLYWEGTGHGTKIGNHAQRLPVHYNLKDIWNGR